VAQRKELLKSSIDSLLLCVIEQQPIYGYEIIRELKRRSQGYFEFKEGTLYPALHRLENAGLVAGKWELLTNGRQRRYYHITAQGRARLEDERNRWLDFLKAMNLIIQPVTP
jgi:DNA-binding PadR family transcriptional regulator